MTTTEVSIWFRRRQAQAGLAIVLSALLLCGSAAALTPEFPEANLIRGRTAAGYPYLNGGISFDEQRLIEGIAHLYNLKIVFARRAGTPTTPAFVAIGANTGGRVEKISLGAPWFYIKLPPGAYTILARFTKHVVLVRDVTIGDGRRTTYLLRGD